MTQIDARHMQKEFLSTLFGSAARAAILRLFMLDPTRAYYQRQIEAVTGLAIRAVQREVDRLTSIALLYRREEGNRIYYQVDTGFSLFDELRSMVLKVATPAERLRGLVVLDEGVRLAFLNESEDRALLVAAEGKAPASPEVGPYAIQVMTSEEFLQALSERAELLDVFLTQGVDLLGRRDDVIWHHIEVAGYRIHKAEGVA